MDVVEGLSIYLRVGGQMLFWPDSRVLQRRSAIQARAHTLTHMHTHMFTHTHTHTHTHTYTHIHTHTHVFAHMNATHTRT